MVSLECYVFFKTIFINIVGFEREGFLRQNFLSIDLI